MNPITKTSALAVCSLLAIGCHSTHEYLVDDWQQIKEPQRVYEIQTVDDSVINFQSDSLGYAVLRETTLERFQGNGSVDTIALSSVKIFRTTKPEPTRTLIGVLLATGVVGLMVASWAHGLRSGSW
jgi:hypothetical protein